PVRLPFDVRTRALADCDAPQVEFVDVGLELVAAGTVDLSDALALLERLAELDIEAGELARDGRPDAELVQASLGNSPAPVERGRSRAQLAKLAPLQCLILGNVLLQDRKPVRLIVEVVLRIVEGLHRDEALVGE